MTDFSSMIANFANSGVTRRRFDAPTLSTTTGRFSTPTYTDAAIVASVQRPSGRQLRLLPEGQRADESLIAYTATSCRTADVASQTLADHLLYEGVSYEVQAVSNWQAHGNFYQLVCLKVGQ